MTTNKNSRYSFASTRPVEYPDFLDIQVKSFREFLQIDTDAERRHQEGLYKVFAENFPITDARNSFVLEFLDYYIDGPRYTIDWRVLTWGSYLDKLDSPLLLYHYHTQNISGARCVSFPHQEVLTLTA